jgi:DNA-binding NtrC family response regulator
MTYPGHRFLVVAQTTTLASALVSWLSESPNELVLANTYAGAKLQLAAHPDVLITEVKLGEYNGLHLALRGQAAGIPTIVLGPTNHGFEREAEQLGATYLGSEDLDSDELAFAIERVLEDARRHETALPEWMATPAGQVLH